MISEPEEQTSSADQKDEELLRLARDRFKRAADAEGDLRTESLLDHRFAALEQWPEMIKQQRELENRPCLTIDRLTPAIRQVTNEQRQNRPQIYVHPVDDSADIKTAEVLEGLIRHIQVNSNAEIAYDTAFEDAVIGGFGYFRIVTEYVEGTLDQEIYIKRIKNPFTVYYDPACQEPDYSDGDFAFVVDHVQADEYKREYPHSKLCSLEDFSSVGDQAPDWITRDSVRVAEYFHREYEEKIRVRLEDGSSPLKEELFHVEGNIAIRKEGEQPLAILKERKDSVCTVYWEKINGAEVLERGKVDTQWIPIIPVLGEDINIDGKRKLFGMVRRAADAQRQYNYMRTAQTEMIALAPRAPWLAAEGTTEDYEHLYRDSNVRNIGILYYKQKDLEGNPAPPPQRQMAEPPIQAITEAIGQAVDDIKANTSIHEASLGARGNEVSAKAILARRNQGETGNFHFSDNFTRSLKHAGRILVQLAAKVYDAPRVLRIIGEDQEHKTVQVNQPTIDQGVQRIYDLTTGKYDVTITVGPSYASKRKEAAEMMTQLVSSDPSLMQKAGDIILKNFDFPGAQELSDRLKKTLPPGLADDDNGQAPIPPQVQAKMQKMQQELETAHAFGQSLHEQLATKQPELDVRLKIAEMHEETARTIALAQIDAKDGQLLLQSQITRLESDMEHFRTMQQASHAAGLQAQQAQAQAEQPASQ